MEPTSISLIADLAFEVAHSCIESLSLALCSRPCYMPGHPSPILSVLERWLVHLKRVRLLKKIYARSTQKRRYISCLSQTSAPRVPQCLYRLKAILSRRSASSATSLALVVCSMQGSRSPESWRQRGGPEGGEGAQCCKVPQCRFISPF